MKPTLFLLAAGMGSRYGGLSNWTDWVRMAKLLWTIQFMTPLTPDLVSSFS
jgi:hypothetical protein